MQIQIPDPHPIRAEHAYSRTDSNMESLYGVVVLLHDEVIFRGKFTKWPPATLVEDTQQEYRAAYDEWQARNFKVYLSTQDIPFAP